jgi:enamine deaminase RidA (YjgF/YER057c/UK114 family)
VNHKEPGPGAYAQRCLRGLAALGVTLSLIACAPALRRQVVSPPGISPLVPAYSVAIRDGDTVFVSGMTGIKPGTQEIIDGGVAARVEIKCSALIAGPGQRETRPEISC